MNPNSTVTCYLPNSPLTQSLKFLCPLSRLSLLSLALSSYSHSHLLNIRFLLCHIFESVKLVETEAGEEAEEEIGGNCGGGRLLDSVLLGKHAVVECRRAFGFARRSQGHGRASTGIRAVSGISTESQVKSLIVSNSSLLVIPFSALTFFPKNTKLNKENVREEKNE